MKRIATLILYLFAYTLSHANGKDSLIVKQKDCYRRLIIETDSVKYNMLLDSLFTLEQQIFYYPDRYNTYNYSGLILKNYHTIISNFPNKKSIKKALEKHSYSSNFVINKALYHLYLHMALTSKTKNDKEYYLYKTIQFYIGPNIWEHTGTREFGVDEYNNSAVKKLNSIVVHEYTALEKECIKNYLIKSSISKDALNAIEDIYSDSIKRLKNTVRLKKYIKIRDKLKDKDFIFNLYKEEYEEISDSLANKTVPVHFKRHIEKNNKDFLMLMGRINSELSLNALRIVASNKNNEFNPDEIRAATMALIRMGDIKFNNYIDKEFNFNSYEYFYMATDEVFFHIGTLLGDTITKTMPSHTAYCLFEKEYYHMKSSRAYRLLWMLIKNNASEDFSFEFVAPGDDFDYTGFCKRAAENEEYEILLNNVRSLMLNDKGKYKIDKNNRIYGSHKGNRFM